MQHAILYDTNTYPYEVVRLDTGPCLYPWHVHRQHSLIGCVTRGHVLLHSPYGTRTLRTGQRFAVPAGTAHSLEIPRQARMVLLCLKTPASACAPKPSGILALDTVRSLICATPQTSWPLRTLAAKAGFSPWHMVRAFKTRFGMTPHAYLLACRISLGRQLLRKGISIIDAALQAGFADQSHFTRLFLRHHRLSPRRFQQAHISTRQD